MKKIITMSGLTAAVLGLASIAYAASGTISLSPATKNVTPGQLVSVTVTANPGVGSAYTVKAKIAYPANLLEVQSFTFSSGWLPLSQSGYDLIDNANGVLIKTAGYAGGLSAPKSLGTIVFKVKAAGTAAITVSSGSMLLDATNGNLFTSGSGSTLTSVQATATPTPSPRLTAVVTAPSPTASAIAASATPVPSVSPSSQTATIGGGLTWGLTALNVGIAIVVFFLVTWYIRRRRNKNRLTL